MERKQPKCVEIGPGPCLACADAQATIAALQADNRTYINERHDNMKQIEQLQADLAERTAELEAAQRKVDLAEKKAWLAAHDVGFFSMWNGTDHSGPPKLALLCNDTFAWATADCEDVLDEQIDTIVELFKTEGEAGVIKWIAQQRNMTPMKSVGEWLYGCDAIKKQRDDLQTELERVRAALERIARYGNDGICPFGCDTPYIAQQALGQHRQGME